MNRFRWLAPESADTRAVDSLAGELAIPAAGARFLVSRGIADADSARRYLEPSPDQCNDPFAFERMREAVFLVEEAAREGRAVLIHGDYDVDGISGTALLFHYLSGLVPSVFRFVPDRRKDGYGVSERAVDWAIEQKVGLVIAVDCGTSDAERLRRLEAAGIAVIVCDHHQLPADGDTAGVLLNPARPGERYPFPSLCGTAIAWKLVQALETSGLRGAHSAESLLDLVALATVADMAPLVDENRYLARAGLRLINRAPRPGLDAIKAFARLSGDQVTARHISFALAPRLNAPGRVSRPRPSLEILCEDVKERALQLASILEEENERRRTLTQRVHEDAMAVINSMEDRDARGGFVIASEGWDEGVLGIAAARLVEQFGRPTILMSPSGGLLKGSGRSVPGVNLKEHLDYFQDCFVRYGGHAQAVGLTMEPDQLDRFASGLSERLRESVAPERGLSLRLDSPLAIEECSTELLDFLARCEPFGEGNEEPVWLVRDVEVMRETSFVGDGHMKFFFQDAQGRRGSAISFGWDRPQAPENLHGRVLDLAVTVRRGTYMGEVYAELYVVDLRAGGG